MHRNSTGRYKYEDLGGCNNLLLIHVFLAGGEDIASQFVPKTIPFNVDDSDNNFSVLELDDYPNYVQENLVEETMSACGHKDDVDILIPSTSMLYSRSPKLVPAIQTEVEQKFFHEAPICQPLVIDLQKVAIRDKQSHCKFCLVSVRN